MSDLGTPRELRPVAEQVLAWVAKQRAQGYGVPFAHLRRIELCALATIEAAMFHDLYGGLKPTGHLDFIGGDPHAETSEVQGQRGAPEGVSRTEEEA